MVGRRVAVKWKLLIKLTSDQIIALAAAINPDGAGASAAWLHSPMPINLFQAFFARTCVEHDSCTKIAAHDAGRPCLAPAVRLACQTPRRATRRWRAAARQ